jgi:hypothetical protein
MQLAGKNVRTRGQSDIIALRTEYLDKEVRKYRVLQKLSKHLKARVNSFRR